MSIEDQFGLSRYNQGQLKPIGPNLGELDQSGLVWANQNQLEPTEVN